MKGEFDSPSKAATDAYRENWERIYQSVNSQNGKAGKTPGIHVLSSNISLLDPAFEGSMYGNGCPIIEEV